MSRELDTESVRSALGRIGDRALPALDFDELSLRANRSDTSPGRTPGQGRRVLLAATAAAVLIGVVATTVVRDGGEDVIADQPPLTEATDQPGNDRANDLTPPEEPEPDLGAEPGEQRPPTLSETAAAVGADVAVAASNDGVSTWTPDAETNFDGLVGYVRSDGEFVYGTSPDNGEFVAATIDGAIVCRGPRRIEHVTRRQDGTYVMAAEDPDPIDLHLAAPDEPLDYPLFAVDCQTGDEQPIEPIHRIGLGDGESLTTYRVGIRAFEGLSDAEGNTFQLRDESGRDLIGDDYIGLAQFRSDGRLLAFGDQRVGVGPHSTKTIGVRNLESGERLWGKTLEGFVIALWFVGDRLVVGTAVDDPTLSGVQRLDTLTVFEADTGRRLAEVEPPDDLVFLG